MDTQQEQRNDLKGKSGVTRLYNACVYSWQGFAFAFKDEQAFRQIVYGTCVGIPLALFLARQWHEAILLIGVFVISLTVELLNSAIENTVDYISPEKHILAQKAKDMGSAAQFVAQCFIVLVWGSFLLMRVLE